MMEALLLVFYALVGLLLTVCLAHGVNRLGDALYERERKQTLEQGQYDPKEVARLERECFGEVLSEDAIKAEAAVEAVVEAKRRQRLGWADRAIEGIGWRGERHAEEWHRWREERHAEEWDRLLRDNGLEED